MNAGLTTYAIYIANNYAVRIMYRLHAYYNYMAGVNKIYMTLYRHCRASKLLSIKMYIISLLLISVRAQERDISSSYLVCIPHLKI